MRHRRFALLIICMVMLTQLASAQQIAEPIRSQTLPTLIPPTSTPSGPNCYQVIQDVPYACVHVLHGGSRNASHRMLDKVYPEYEMSCEVKVPLQSYLDGKKLAAEKGMQIDFSIYGLYGGGEGRHFANGHKRIVGPDEFDSFNVQHPADTSQRVSYNIHAGSQDLGATSGKKVAWWRVNLDTTNKILSLRSIWNGWGRCRWKDHCYAYINQLKLTFEVCES